MKQDKRAKPHELRKPLIRDMEAEDRPREKALKNGIKSLSDVELMALLFSTGIKGKSVIELSRDILTDNNNHLSELARLPIPEILKRYKGIGPAKTISLLAALELGARSASDAAKVENLPITSSKLAYERMRHHFFNLNHEEFWVLLMAQSGKPVAEVKIGQGGVSSTTVDVKLILRAAIENLASSIIVFHNHPSGNAQPSAQDDKLTTKLSEAAKLIDTRVLDHIIMTDGQYYSYLDVGRI